MNSESKEKVSALELCKLHHAYGTKMAVDGVDLDIAPGELVCLLGPSGCGKSTTLRLIAGIERPMSGEILIDGTKVAGDGIFRPPEDRRTGLVFQDFALFPHLTVEDNVAFGLRGLSPDALSDRVRESLSSVGMTASSWKFPNALSGGEQQRVALARALAPRPHLMLMDEPFSGLDQRLRDRIRDETLSLLEAEGTATLLVTHDPQEAMRMADRIALMRDGKLVQVGAPEEFYSNPVDLQAAAFFSDLNLIHGVVDKGRLETGFGNVPVSDYPNGAEVTLALRAHAFIPVKAEGNANGTRVLRTRMLGEYGLVEFCLDDRSDKVFFAHLEPDNLPEPGQHIGFELRPEATFFFEGHQTI